VKMVHNGIEYGDMQLIAEAYSLLKGVLNMNNEELAKTFDSWNTGHLNSFLIEITAQIFRKKDTEAGHPNDYLVDKVLDKAGQKGTGKWTVIAALDYGVPVTLIAEAVFARTLSSLKEERVNASKLLHGPTSPVKPADRQTFIDNVRDALYAAKLVSYAQGYQLMRATAAEFKWSLNFGGIALMWRGGCIIRSTFLSKIKEAFDRNPSLSNLLLDPFFKEQIHNTQPAWRSVLSTAVLSGMPVPAMSAALAYFDGFRLANGSANLIQAQRDFFGAHTFERIDSPAGKFFHAPWTGVETGSAISGSYSV